MPCPRRQRSPSFGLSSLENFCGPYGEFLLSGAGRPPPVKEAAGLDRVGIRNPNTCKQCISSRDSRTLRKLLNKKPPQPRFFTPGMQSLETLEAVSLTPRGTLHPNRVLPAGKRNWAAWLDLPQLLWGGGTLWLPCPGGAVLPNIPKRTANVEPPGFRLGLNFKTLGFYVK